MKFEKTEVWGFEHAIRGMRNSFNSWDKSDSECVCDSPCMGVIHGGECIDACMKSKFNLGDEDYALMKKLIKSGSSHRKFLRQIFVSVDITAPLYWWKEFDTYKVGTVANSCSTMHTLTKNPLTIECFETPDFKEYDEIKEGTGELFKQSWTNHIAVLELLRKAYVKTNDKRFWKQIIGLLPEGYLQKRTVTMSYENILAMVEQRKNHKLDEWSKNFMGWVNTLPYAELFNIEE